MQGLELCLPTLWLCPYSLFFCQAFFFTTMQVDVGFDFFFMAACECYSVFEGALCLEWNGEGGSTKECGPLF